MSSGAQKNSPEAQADIDDLLGGPPSVVSQTTSTTTTTITTTAGKQQPTTSSDSAYYNDSARVNPAFSASGDHLDANKPRLSVNDDADDGFNDDRQPFIHQTAEEVTAFNQHATNRPSSASTFVPPIPARTAKPHHAAATKQSSSDRRSFDEITPASATDAGASSSSAAAAVDDSHQQVHEDEELAKKLQMQLNLAEQTASAVRRSGEESQTRDNQIHQDEELAKSLWEEERRAAAAAQQQAGGGGQVRRPGSGGSSFDSDVGSVGMAAGGPMIVDPQQMVPQRRIDCTLAQAKLTKSYALITKMDPYAKVRIGHVVLETDTIPAGALNPRWNKTFSCLVPPGVDSISIEIYDEKKLTSDELIAWADVKIPDQVFNGETLDDWWPLSGKQGEGKEGMVELVLSSRMVQAYPPQHVAMRPVVHPVGGVAVASPAAQQRVAAVPQWTDEDVKQLHDMFPTVDEEIIKTVMVEKRGNKEEVINVLLNMST